MTPRELGGVVVVDTSVVSILFSQISPQYDYYQSELEGYDELAISFQTLEEALYGAYNANWGERRIRELADHLRLFRVIYPDNRLIDISATLRSETRKLGRELTSADAWIAATAIMMDCPLASDDRDFDAVSDRLVLIRRLG